jgi:hypothetical protein
MNDDWSGSALCFLQSMHDPVSGGSRSVPNGPVTLYGTCYASLGKFYLGANGDLPDEGRRFIVECQDSTSGLMIGPELRDFKPPPGAIHDREHLLMHLTCTAVPTCQHFGIQLKFPIPAAHRFCDLDYLDQWMDRRDLRKAWFEGNNILFVGQLLVYLRDVERCPGAQAALDRWFDWLDTHVDPATGLWGTNGHCSALEAVCGGYHQLLVYYHEDLRFGLKRCLEHILSTQNPDGGFPYNLNCAQSHMGIPGTQAPANVSATFSTWFRIHTLALIAEILPEDRAFSGIKLRFSSSLSMGWHQSPPGWFLELRARDRLSSAKPRVRYYGKRTKQAVIGFARGFRKCSGRLLKRTEL